jgi:hypothetical protein
MPVTVFVMHRRATFPGAPPFFEDHNWMLVGFAPVLIAPWTAVVGSSAPSPTPFSLERAEPQRHRARLIFARLVLTVDIKPL